MNWLIIPLAILVRAVFLLAVVIYFVCALVIAGIATGLEYLHDG